MILDLIKWLVCMHCNISPEYLNDSTKREKVRARQLIVLISRRLNYPNSEIAFTIGMSHSAAAILYKTATNRARSDKDFLRILEEIEANIENSVELLKEYQKVFYAKKIRSL